MILCTQKKTIKVLNLLVALYDETANSKTNLDWSYSRSGKINLVSINGKEATQVGVAVDFMVKCCILIGADIESLENKGVKLFLAGKNAENYPYKESCYRCSETHLN